MLDSRLLAIIGSFSDAGYRTKAAKKLAEALRAEDIILFSKDPILQILLPAPGFPQTLPNGILWKEFLKGCLDKQYESTELVSPYTKQKCSANGMVASDGSVLVLLGNKPDMVLALQVVALIPLIVSALSSERASLIAKGELETEALYSERAKVLSNALDATRRSLEAELRKRDEFLSIASHELKTPLTSLKLQSQIRNRRLIKGELVYFNEKNLKNMFETDERHIDRLARLIDDMLDISRINSGKLDLRLETFDMCALVKDVLERYSSQIQDYNSEVCFSCTDVITGKWDRFRIEQVVTNLLTNALRYGNQLPIEIKVYKRDGFVFIEVIDSGIGIAEDSQARIFERFERAISANEISGMGLGLYIVKQILEMHRGFINVESELGQGSRFIVQLPLEQDYSL